MMNFHGLKFDLLNVLCHRKSKCCISVLFMKQFGYLTVTAIGNHYVDGLAIYNFLPFMCST
jgi:hypothetical protein